VHLELMRTKDKELIIEGCPEDYTTARIWHCKYKSLESLAELKNLKVLVVASFPNDNMEFLTSLKSLSFLRILHMPKIRSACPLAELPSIRDLSLSTLPGWDGSGKKTVLDSLEPISKISELRHIELIGVCPESKKLTELEYCPKLETGWFGGYPKEEIERFYTKTGIAKKGVPNPDYEI
jgi:hypothetical protein